MPDAETKALFMGFEKCEFVPDQDPCESCHKKQRQLYFRKFPFETDDGEHVCLVCIENLYRLNSS